DNSTFGAVVPKDNDTRPRHQHHITLNATRAHALLPYPRGFHRDARDSGWRAPVSSQARAVTRNGPGWTSTASDHRRHDHLLGAWCRLARRHVPPSSRDTSTRRTPRPSPAMPYPRMISKPAGIRSPSVGARMSQLSASDDNEMPSPGPTVSASVSGGKMR